MRFFRSTFASLLTLVVGGASACRSAPLATFETPELAMRALADVAGTEDSTRLELIFGTRGAELLRSGDEVADREDALRVKHEIQEKLVFAEASAETTIALLGAEGWPFPIPLVREGATWRFDVEAGREELANRRVGRNELLTIATLHEYVDAQREYRSVGRDGNPPAFAQRVISSPGRHDGLSWPTAAGEPESPLGPLVAAAAAEGYAREESPTPFHGYLFRTLTGQGPDAPGGTRSYLDERGQLVHGFALLAWPAKYGSSGVMTFLVDQRGLVFQKDLGRDTARIASRMKTYSPDQSWDPTVE